MKNLRENRKEINIENIKKIKLFIFKRFLILEILIVKDCYYILNFFILKKFKIRCYEFKMFVGGRYII